MGSRSKRRARNVQRTFNSLIYNSYDKKKSNKRFCGQNKIHEGEERERLEREMNEHNEGRNADKWGTKEEAEGRRQRKTVTGKEDRRIADG